VAAVDERCVARPSSATTSRSPTKCFLCDIAVGRDGKPLKAQPRPWALACIREEVLENGQIVGYVDATRDVTRKIDGRDEKSVEKAFVMVSMAYRNCFTPLLGMWKRYGSSTDRDYLIERKGEGLNDTSYNIIPLDPLEMEDGRHLRPQGARCRGPVPDRPRHRSQIDQRMTEDFYNKFFDTRVTYVPDDNTDVAEVARRGQAIQRGYRRSRVAGDAGASRATPHQRQLRTTRPMLAQGLFGPCIDREAEGSLGRNPAPGPFGPAPSSPVSDELSGEAGGCSDTSRRSIPVGRWNWKAEPSPG
jgi:hypothetical protein